MFNIILIIVSIPAALTVQFESSLMSFIIPTAACDMQWTSDQKGLLNSMSFLGMVISGFLWGFLLDTLGRKKMLFLGYLFEIFVVLGQGFLQNIYFLCIFKFFGGTLTGGLYMGFNTLLHEFHATEHRGKIQMIYASMFCISNIIIPLLSSAILPLNFCVKFGYINFCAWNLLILVSGTTTILTTIFLYFLPETPKFLMTVGKNEEALKVFRRIYHINTWKKEETYPIKYLIQETVDRNQASNQESWLQYIRLGWQQISPLFNKENRLKLLLVCTVQCIIQTVLNSYRLYLPQILQAIHEYQIASNESATNLCEVLELLRVPDLDEEPSCTVDMENNFQVYVNSMIIGLITLITYGMAGTLINIFGKKKLLYLLGVIGSMSMNCLYFSNNTTTTLALSSSFLACVGVCFDIFITIIVVIFPTTLRAMAFSVSLLFGRTLTVAGNMIYPMLVQAGCAPPFLTYGCLTLVSILLSCFIPNTDKMDMK